MKKITLLLLFMCVTALLSAQDITFTFQNARITNDGTDDFYEADIYIESTVDFKLGSGQIYFNYNTAAFGTNIQANGNFEYLQPTGSILAETYSSFPAYQSFIDNDNTLSRVSTSFQQGVSSGTITANNVTTTAKHLFSIKIRYVDSSLDAMVSFETGSVFLDQFFTACGPSTFGFPNCTTNPGVQLVNDTFISTGAVVDVTPPVITLLGSTPVTVEKGSSYTDAGATANDDVDGDVTASIVIVNNVDVNVVGSYTVTYNVSDAEGNAATEVVRTVNVVDTTAPVIILTGANPQTIEQGDTYNELGATADDGSTVVIDNSAVNTSTIGSYTVTYNATDAAGNAATQVTRTVNVVADATVPVITLLGSSPIIIERGTTYTDAGATASDNFDGDITASIVTVNAVDANVAGSYTVTYNVQDAAGNAAIQVTRTVNVVDTTAPVITLSGANPQTLERTNAYTELGATADDGSTVVIDASAVNINVVGSYTVTYNASDASGNAATQVTRTVNVVDTTAPIITLSGANPQTIERTNSYTELGATTDDGSTVVIDASSVNTNVVGSYTVTYNAIDASGNDATQVTRTVNVVDTTAPVITLTGSNPLTLEQGDTYNEPGATADDGSTVVIDNSAVNTSTIGSYTVTYNASDAAGNAATQVTRTVNVVADATVPVITLLGSTPVTIERGTTYIDAGATASDNFDGDITASIVTVNAVDANVAGNYTVTYNVQDAAGNAAIQVTRTVNVVDTTAPVITLSGANPQTIERTNAYTELGATTDDGSLIVIDASAINTNVVGSYTVTYNASDASGNAATQVTRTVNVVDTTAPIITLSGANPQTIERTNAYTELGATADDGSTVVIDASSVNTNVVGSYTVTYNASDASGNAAIQVTRTVNVVDTTAPIITLNGANPQRIEQGGTYNELGATTDDGSTVVIDNSAVNTSLIGSYMVTYNATDASGNVATQVTRTVTVVVDATPPVITLLGSTPVVIEIGTAYTDAGATASDTQDGDLTASIITVNSVDVNVLGSYTVTYNVRDVAGNAATEVVRTVNVVDSCPIFDLPADNFVIQAVSETCENKNNGIISITAGQSLDYQATINGDMYSFSSNLAVTDLSPGVYSACIGITGVSNCEQCFEVVVEEAPILDGKTSLDNQKMNIEIATGTAPYTVMINNTVSGTYDTQNFAIDVKPGDTVEVFSSVGCEGKLATKVELLGSIQLYPNPTQSNVEILVPGLDSGAMQIEIHNAIGTLVLSKEYTLSGGKVILPMETLRAGVYFVSVGGTTTPQTFKVIKQ